MKIIRRTHIDEFVYKVRNAHEEVTWYVWGMYCIVKLTITVSLFEGGRAIQYGWVIRNHSNEDQSAPMWFFSA